MGKMNIKLSDDLEEQFRKKVANQKGLKKGNIGKAFEEAIKEWLEKK